MMSPSSFLFSKSPIAISYQHPPCPSGTPTSIPSDLYKLQLTNMFDLPSPGLTIHLRYMHYDLDPSSATYLQHYQKDGEEPIGKNEYTFGTHRLPRSQEGRHAFLWAPFNAMGKGEWQVKVHPEERDKTTVTIYVLLERMMQYMHRTEDVMLA
jgi:hypothetical protein